VVSSSRKSSSSLKEGVDMEKDATSSSVSCCDIVPAMTFVKPSLYSTQKSKSNNLLDHWC
jgi:hypothetical protein